MTEANKSNRPLAEWQVADARRLETAFNEWKAAAKAQGAPSSQDAFGAAAGDYSQSTVSQYCKGKIPLNAKALTDFCLVLNVPPSEISPTIASEIAKSADAAMIQAGANSHAHGMAPFTNVKLSDTTRQPGLVFAWDEVIRMFRAGIEDALPDVFSVEITDDALLGRARKGDVVTLCRSKRDVVEAGDGVLVRMGSDNFMLRIYKPKGDGSFVAEATNPNFQPLNSIADNLVVLAVVVGVPSCRWSNL